MPHAAPPWPLRHRVCVDRSGERAPREFNSQVDDKAITTQKLASDRSGEFFCTTMP
jgi:hypothetical protein